MASRDDAGEGAALVSGVLAKILATKAREVHTLKHQTCYTRIAEGPRPVMGALRRAPGDPLRLLAEHKRKSPSAGALSAAMSVEDRVLAYARGGAAMISVLTDEAFFGGSFRDLVDARRALDAAGLPTRLLAKEFVVDERQLREASACGADAALLVVRIVAPTALRSLVQNARTLGLEPLVEVTSEEELTLALDAGATLVGVNARDLDTLTMDAERAARVLAAIPKECVALYLSGIRGPDDVRRVAATRADGALIGEALMRAADPAPLLDAMVRAATTG